MGLGSGCFERRMKEGGEIGRFVLLVSFSFRWKRAFFLAVEMNETWSRVGNGGDVLHACWLWFGNVRKRLLTCFDRGKYSRDVMETEIRNGCETVDCDAPTERIVSKVDALQNVPDGVANENYNYEILSICSKKKKELSN